MADNELNYNKNFSEARMNDNDEKMHVQIGDTVIIRGELNKQVIGKVEDIKQEHGSFTYYEYLRPEEIPGGRKSYHGKHELIKSDRIVEAKLEEVINKCQILRMLDYIDNKYNRNIPTFVFRQYYDATNKKLIPEKLETQYFGEKVPNPDEEQQAHSYLHGEDNFLGEGMDDELLAKRRSNTGGLETVVPLKKQKADFDFTSFGSPKETPPSVSGSAAKKQAAAALAQQAAKRPSTDKTKVVSMKALTENIDEKRQEMLLKKADIKSQALLEKYKHSTSLSIQLPEQERVRQKIRENFFYSLVFGLEECKLKQAAGMTDDLREYIVEVSKLLMKDEKAQLEHIKNLTLSIEANLYHKHNKEVGKTSQYSNRARLIFMNLKHKKNFDLRVRVLVETVSPSQLCSMTEDELAPVIVKENRKEEQEKYLTSRLIADEEKFIPKAKKDELLVGAPEDNGLPPLSLATPFETKERGVGRNEILEEEPEADEDDFLTSKARKMKDPLEELNPRRFAEKAEQRFKNLLPEEEAKKLLKGLKS